MRSFVRWVILVFSGVAALLDALNVSSMYVGDKSFAHDGVHFIALWVAAILVATFSWIAPFQFGFARADRKYGEAIIWLVITTICTIFNMAAALAYIAPTFPYVQGVSGPRNIYVPTTGILIFHVNDWLGFMASCLVGMLLLAILVVNVEKKKRLSPAEEMQRLQDDIEYAKVADLKRQKLDPLKAKLAEERAHGLKGQAVGLLKGVGINLPTRKAKINENSEESGEGGAGTPDQAPEATLASILDSEIDTVMATKIYNADKPTNLRISERTLRGWCTDKPIDPSERDKKIPATMRTIKGRRQWGIDAEWFKQRYPKSWEAYQKKQQQLESRRRNRHLHAV